MKVIPVIDILNGIAVHAVRGERQLYQPLQSLLVKSAEPLEIAKAFQTIGFNELYIADLDAIIDCTTSFADLKRISNSTQMKLMVDAGITNIERAQNLLENNSAKLIIGTETLKFKDFVAEAVDTFGKDRVILSLDLKDNRVLVQPKFNGSSEALPLLLEFKKMGLSQVIVLDLTRVGSGIGPNKNFLKESLEMGFDIFLGGGVRNLEDLLDLDQLGVSGVLLATALHSGKITVEQLRQNNFLN